MKKYSLSIIIALLAILCISCKGKETVTQTKEPKATPAPEITEGDNYVTVTFSARSLENNTIGEETTRTMYVYLPPSYNEGNKSYPVVYYLHGYYEEPTVFPRLKYSMLTEEFNKGGKEFICVSVDGYNKYKGSFYANSPVAGNWEDYVVSDVVSVVDANFRTIKSNKARGICGFSMGGFGAYNLALKHPDVFSATLMMSPGLLQEGDMQMAIDSWGPDINFLTGYGNAFSPRVGDEENTCNSPKMTGTEEDNQVVKEWYSGFGEIKEKVDAYLALDNPLTAIKIVYAENDMYKWIPRGCKALEAYLKEKNVAYTESVHDLGHSLPPGVVENQIIPFFTENLSFE